jgi:hypothetical protein
LHSGCCLYCYHLPPGIFPRLRVLYSVLVPQTLKIFVISHNLCHLSQSFGLWNFAFSFRMSIIVGAFSGFFFFLYFSGKSLGKSLGHFQFFFFCKSLGHFQIFFFYSGNRWGFFVYSIVVNC